MDDIQKISVVLIFVFLTGCTTTQRSALVGGLAGSTIGGIVGHQKGDGVKGAAIGGLAGTAIGVLWEGKEKKTPYEKGYEAGYKQGQADYAKSSWDINTGRCAGKQGGN